MESRENYENIRFLNYFKGPFNNFNIHEHKISLNEFKLLKIYPSNLNKSILTIGETTELKIIIKEVDIKNEKIAIGKTNEEPENKLSNNSDFFIKEAKLRAEKIIFDAEKEANKINERKTQIEIQLRELIHTEREVIRNYESISSNKIENNSTTD